MPIDPTISLKVNPPQTQTFDPVRILSNVMDLRAKEMEFADLQRQHQEREAVRQVLREAGGDMTKALPKLMQVSPTTGLQYQKFMAEQGKAFAELRSKELDATEKKLTLGAQIARGMLANPAAFHLGKHAISQLLGPELANYLGDDWTEQTPQVLEQAIQWGTNQTQAIQQMRLEETKRSNLATETQAAENAQALAARTAVDDARQARAQQQTEWYQRQQLALSAGQLDVARGNLAVRQAEAKEKGPDGKPKLTPSMRAGIDRLKVTVSQIEALDDRLTQQTGLAGKVAGYAQEQIAAWTGTDEDATVYQGLSDSLLPALARASGEVGNLAEKEQERFSKLAPKVRDPLNVRRKKIQVIKAIAAAAEGGKTADEMRPLLDAVGPAASASGTITVGKYTVKVK